MLDPETGAHRHRRAGEGWNPAKARTEMQHMLKELGYTPDPDKRGGLQDLSSDRRIDTIIDTQTKMAQGYARHEAAQDPAVLDAFPADEMYRQSSRRAPRDWDIRWNEARASLGDSTTA